MANGNSETSPAMEKAVQLLQRGETVRAEETMLQAVREAEQRFGPGSPQTAVYRNELGTILLNLEQYDRAVEAYRAACAGPPPKADPDLRDRLTFLMNLGMALQYAGRLDEAEEALRRGVAGRREYYGTQHAGYGFGLEPLADLLLRQGKLAEAQAVIQETVETFWQTGHPRIATALALRAEIWKAAGVTAPPFAGLEGLPEEIIQDLGARVCSRVEEADPLVLRPVLADAMALCWHRLGEGHPVTLNLLAHQANLERELGPHGDHALRQEAIHRVIGIYERLGQEPDVIQTLQGLAVAQTDAGQTDAALATYAAALARAERLPHGAQRSQVRRNYGLFLAELERRPEAEVQLRAAVQDAERVHDHEMLGRALVALGIFLQHDGRLDEAAPLLQQAARHLAPAHPDAICGRSHLEAIRTGAACGCGNPEGAVAEAFRDFVLERLPRDLLEELHVGIDDGDFQINVALQREPTPEELEHLNRVMEHALAEFRKRLAAPY